MKEFQWASIPKKDYLYFLDARMYCHTRSFLSYYFRGSSMKYGQGECNTYYSCLKPNGDYNSVFSYFRVPKGYVIGTYSSASSLESAIFSFIRDDIALGQIGEHVYALAWKGGRFLLSKIPLKLHPNRRRIASMLAKYREGGVKTNSNESYVSHFDFADEVNPTVVVKPFSKRRVRLMRGK